MRYAIKTPEEAAQIARATANDPKRAFEALLDCWPPLVEDFLTIYRDAGGDLSRLFDTVMKHKGDPRIITVVKMMEMWRRAKGQRKCVRCGRALHGAPVRVVEESLRQRLSSAGITSLPATPDHFDWEDTPDDNPVALLVKNEGRSRSPEYAYELVCGECVRKSVDPITLLGKIKVEDD